MEKQIKIYNFFGEKRQRMKMIEEEHEIFMALSEYLLTPNKANILALCEEVNDLMNVLEGIAKCKYGVNIEELKAIKEGKLYRTMKIIKKCKSPDDYEEVRRGL